MTDDSPKTDVAIDTLASALLEDDRQRVWRRTDRMFAALMGFQFVAGIVWALVISPRTWIGDTYEVHVHVVAAVVLGGLISSLPIALALMLPGRTVTRHVVAVGQMLTSALLIHLSGGRIETHFHIFGSLAFLAFYRDWRVLVSATVVVAIDHCVRGLFFPLSVFGVVTASEWRWIEHAAWVVFEDVFLVLACVRGEADATQRTHREAQVSVGLSEATALALRIAEGDLSVDAPDRSGIENHRDLDTLFGAQATMLENLRRLGAAAVSVGEGDLRPREVGRGEVGQAFQTMLERQREAVRTLSHTSVELAASTRELLATLRHQEEAAADQAGAVEEVRRTMAGLVEAAEGNGSVAGAVHERAGRSRSASESAAERATQLDGLTSRIAERVTALTKIADKSDLLALNAALEGTKAGEAGRGFILVAEEMRRLAESVLEAATDIGGLLEEIRRASRVSVLATEEGLKLSEETTDSARSIRDNSTQQRGGIQQTNEAINEISLLLNRSASGARESTAAISDLSQLAHRIEELLETYRLGEHEGEAA